MANKKKETEEVEETQTEATVENTEASEEISVEAKAEEATEEKPKKSRKTEDKEEISVINSVIDTVTSAVTGVADALINAISSDETPAEKASKRAQRIGVVTSDKMTKTVTVRVDRLIKHPKYRRYVRRKKQFMAHDEMGAGIGDKVRIIETRPLSARKRWRVVEIIQKAAK